MNQELLTNLVVPKFDANLGKLVQMFGKYKEEIVTVKIKDAAFAVKDTTEKSGQIWDSVLLVYVHGRGRSLGR
tara:strand:+ start:152 stop:370 length:219 start_codon:yes stop_codon:yes gene_type:complete